MVNKNDFKNEFEDWFRKSGYNENGEDDFKAPWWECNLTYEEEFVECAFLAFMAGKGINL